MKKYIEPQIEVFDVELTQILCASYDRGFDPDAMP